MSNINKSLRGNTTTKCKVVAGDKSTSSHNQCGFNPFPKQKACIYYLTQDSKVKFVGYGGSA